MLAVSFLLSIFTKIFKPAFILKNRALEKTFNPGLPDLVFRFLAFLIALAVKYKFGPDMVWGDSTGKEMMGLLYTAMIILFYSSFLLETLLDFGLMDFLGVLAEKFMKSLFTLPGKAARRSPPLRAADRWESL